MTIAPRGISCGQREVRKGLLVGRHTGSANARIRRASMRMPCILARRALGLGRSFPHGAARCPLSSGSAEIGIRGQGTIAVVKST
jgi:hypothetical protein